MLSQPLVAVKLQCRCSAASPVFLQVVGVPDERLGEEVCACVRLRAGAAPLTAATLRDFSKGKMAHYKLPRYCAVLPDFPRTLSGKIQKFVLREQCAADLSQGVLDDCLKVGVAGRERVE